MGVNKINLPLPSPNLHSALTCWLHSPMQEGEAARLRQWCGHWRSGPVGLCTAVGRDRDTQEAWTVQSMVGTGQTRPGQPVERAPKLASPNRPSRSQDGGSKDEKAESGKMQLQTAFSEIHRAAFNPNATSPGWTLVWRGFKE